MFSKSFSWEFKLAWKAYVAGPTKLDPYLEQLEKNVSTDKAKYDANQKSGKFPFVPRVYSPKIKVVGCWDTVASLGLPWNPISDPGGVSGEYAHFDGSLAPGMCYHIGRIFLSSSRESTGIEHAFHALALDECRGPFTPTLWYLPEDKEVVKSECISAHDCTCLILFLPQRSTSGSAGSPACTPMSAGATQTRRSRTSHLRG